MFNARVMNVSQQHVHSQSTARMRNDPRLVIIHQDLVPIIYYAYYLVCGYFNCTSDKYNRVDSWYSL